MATDDLIERLGGGEATFGELREEVRQIHKYFDRSLRTAKLFALNSDDAKFYDGAIVMFGDDVILAFGSAVADIGGMR